ncbi:MAG TPA: hypothetical protein QGH10_22250, partial [Armatimonadota bacterium]|nr:hypothetical protein [Armatimonadota bacterium]
SGADGVYFFNVFSPEDQRWRELGDPALLAGLDKTYVAYSAKTLDSYLGEGQEAALGMPPVLLREGETQVVRFHVGENVRQEAAEEALSELKLSLYLGQLTSQDDISFRLNGTALSGLKPPNPLSATAADHWLECAPNPTQINQGENRVEATLNRRSKDAQEPLLLSDVWLSIGYGDV